MPVKVGYKLHADLAASSLPPSQPLFIACLLTRTSNPLLYHYILVCDTLQNNQGFSKLKFLHPLWSWKVLNVFSHFSVCQIWGSRNLFVQYKIFMGNEIILIQGAGDRQLPDQDRLLINFFKWISLNITYFWSKGIVLWCFYSSPNVLFILAWCSEANAFIEKSST